MPTGSSSLAGTTTTTSLVDDSRTRRNSGPTPVESSRIDYRLSPGVKKPSEVEQNNNIITTTVTRVSSALPNTVNGYEDKIEVVSPTVQNGYHVNSIRRSQSALNIPSPVPQSSPQVLTTGLQSQNSQDSEARKLTPYERAVQMLANDPQYQKEITLGKRVGMYKVGRELGAGNFSKVKLAHHSILKEKVAVKVMEKAKIDYKTQRLLQREIQNMENTHHPNIIRLFEVVDTLSRIYLVLEFAGGGELYSRVVQAQKLSEAEAKQIFAQVVSAVMHLHENHVIHRDIKAENVFFSSPHTVKLGDFGFSIQNDGAHNSLNTFCGSPPYAAPELFRDNSYVGEFVDAWALGVLLYFMVTGSTPFRGDTVSEIKKLVLIGEFYMPAYLSTQCQDVISGLLRMEPSARLSLPDVVDQPWLQGEEFPKPLPKISLTPSEDKLSGDSHERDVWNNLEKLGVTPQMLRNSESRDARHSIIGIYRLALWQVYKRSEEAREMRLSRSLTPGSPNGRKGPKGDAKGPKGDGLSKDSKWTRVKVVSRACTIL